jgi:hypothetical protein
VIYPDRRYRNQAIESCVAQPRTGWGSLTILSAQPETDANFFRSREKRKTGRRALPHASVVDVTRALSKHADPTGSIMSLLKKARSGRQKGSHALIIGDWAHQTYGDIHVALAVEESESREDNAICCYREEGFWSLECEQIARIFELHRRVMFGSSIFEMGGP